MLWRKWEVPEGGGQGSPRTLSWMTGFAVCLQLNRVKIYYCDRNHTWPYALVTLDESRSRLTQWQWHWPFWGLWVSRWGVRCQTWHREVFCWSSPAATAILPCDSPLPQRATRTPPTVALHWYTNTHAHTPIHTHAHTHISSSSLKFRGCPHIIYFTLEKERLTICFIHVIWGIRSCINNHCYITQSE